jgi:hypothetical protein
MSIGYPGAIDRRSAGARHLSQRDKSSVLDECCREVSDTLQRSLPVIVLELREFVLSREKEKRSRQLT